jgi:type II secretory pathway component PulF
VTATDRQFRYTAVSSSGVAVSDTLTAIDRRSALQMVSKTNLIVTELVETKPVSALISRGQAHRQRKEHMLILRQLSLLLGARVDLMEAVDAIRLGLPKGSTQDALLGVSAALRRGEKLAPAIAAALPGFPRYVHALIEAGEGAGRLDHVLNEAAGQLAFEDGIRREIRDALMYPIFLMAVGLAVVIFMFIVVVPRFAKMIGPKRADVEGFSNLIFQIGETANSHTMAVAVSIAAVVAAIILGATHPHAAPIRAVMATITPGFKTLYEARQRVAWARIMAFAAEQRVGLIEANRMALSAVAPGSFRDALETVEPALRSGRTLADALGDSEALSLLDLSLIRAGQKAGALTEMYRVISVDYEQRLRSGLKRATQIIEQAAIIVVASGVGTIVIGLVTAMTSVYETIQ